MSEHPYMPLFAGDYLADTDHLTTEEHGAYLLLLMAMWRRNAYVPNDDKDLARITRLSGPKWRAVKSRLLPMLTVEGEFLTQKRLKEEWDYAKENSKKQSDKAYRRWNKIKGLADAGASAAGHAEAMPLNLNLNSESTEANASVVTSAKPKLPVEEAFQGYNLKAEELGLPQAQKLTSTRRTKLGARLREHGLEGWSKALEELGTASCLTGSGASGWRADIDFLLKPDKFQRVLEGGYRDRERTPTVADGLCRKNGTGWYVKAGCEEFAAHKQAAKDSPRYWDFVAAEKSGAEVKVDDRWPRRR